jgi:hypothetical protein
MTTVFALALVLAVLDLGAQSAVLRTVKGKVEIQNPGEQTWQAASSGMEVPTRATISTGFGGSAVLEMGASTLTVHPLTRLRIDELTTQNSVARTNLFMPVGRIRAEVKSAKGTASDFTVRSPEATAAVRGTGFESDGVHLQVFESVVTFSSQSGISMNVHEGETCMSDGGGSPKGGADEREGNTAVDSSTSLTGAGGIGRGSSTGLGIGTITVKFQ